MRSHVDDGRGSSRPRCLDGAVGLASAEAAVLLAAVLLAAVLLAAVLLAAAVLAAIVFTAVSSAPALAQTSEIAPDYVLEEDGTVVIEGDGATDCTSFAFLLDRGDFDFESQNIPTGAQRVLEQCEEAGLLETGGGSPSVSANASPSPEADGEVGGLPDTGAPIFRRC